MQGIGGVKTNDCFSISAQVYLQMQPGTAMYFLKKRNRQKTLELSSSMLLGMRPQFR
jgi:hypothetical protein